MPIGQEDRARYIKKTDRIAETGARLIDKRMRNGKHAENQRHPLGTLSAEKRMELGEQYKKLLTLQGVGKTLGLTIMLETGPISRFAQVGNYCSYCRKVSTKWISNDKKKGKGNKKSGNKYLAWAFSEAAEIARRYYPEARTYYQRKMQKTNAMVAHQALSHKLARAAYYIMRDGV